MEKIVRPSTLVGALLVAATAVGGCSRPDIQFPQFVQDEILVHGIAAELAAQFTLAVGGATIGPLDGHVDCEGGGSTGVSGVLSSDGYEVTFALEACKILYVDSDLAEAANLTLNGEVDEVSYWAAGANRFIKDLHAADLEMAGELALSDHTVSVDQSCALSSYFEENGVSTSGSGKVCGREVSIIYDHSACQ